MTSLRRRPPSSRLASCCPTQRSHSSPGSPYGRNFSIRFCSSLKKERGCSPSLLARGESSRWPESVGLIWNKHPHLELAKDLVGKYRFRLFTVSHQTITCMPRSGPSRRIGVEVVGGLASSSRFEKLKSSSRRRRSRNRGRSWMNKKHLGTVGF